MPTGLRRAKILVLLLATVAGGSSAHAQANRRWVDPPGDLGPAAPPGQPPSADQTPPAGAAPAAPPGPGNLEAQRSTAPAAPAQTGSLEPQRPAAPRPSPAFPGPAVRSAQPERAPLPDEPRSAARPAAPPPQPPAQAPPIRSAQPERPAAVAPQAGPSFAERTPPRETLDSRLATREDAARDLLNDYLDLWSAPNPLTLAGGTEFYAPSVIFHGRSMSTRALFEEKRRFIQRWPERRYRARPGTVGVACGPGGETCTVRSVFDFTAADPERGRRSQGVATLELVVAFGPDERPVIMAENSLVHGRGRASAGLGSGLGSGEPDDVP